MPIHKSKAQRTDKNREKCLPEVRQAINKKKKEIGFCTLSLSQQLQLFLGSLLQTNLEKIPRFELLLYLILIGTFDGHPQLQIAIQRQKPAGSETKQPRWQHASIVFGKTT